MLQSEKTMIYVVFLNTFRFRLNMVAAVCLLTDL